ncbi:hypothetical protein, partial [Burkholderia diffusa]|uniref:hypothetical protein n=1 Tax=Burkholderia diffusa TaxID=488732 RepID=UPI001BAC614D
MPTMTIGRRVPSAAVPRACIGRRPARRAYAPDLPVAPASSPGIGLAGQGTAGAAAVALPDAVVEVTD